MANFRQIHVKIWKDNWFLDLDPKEKLLYIYLFSNDLTSLSGIYQISQKVIAFETGLNNQWIAKALSNFQTQGKIEYEDGYIWLKKLRKYHETSSHTVQIRIKNDLDNIPDIPLKAQYISYYDPGIPYLYPNDTDLLKEEEEKEYEKEKEKDINKELPHFLEMWKFYFPDKPQPREPFTKIKAKLKTRLKDDYFELNYEKALEIASKSEFVKNGGWFDALWFLHNEENWEKCLNGKYKNNGTSRRKSQAEQNKEATEQAIYDMKDYLMEE